MKRLLLIALCLAGCSTPQPAVRPYAQPLFPPLPPVPSVTKRAALNVSAPAPLKEARIWLQVKSGPAWLDYPIIGQPLAVGNHSPVNGILRTVANTSSVGIQQARGVGQPWLTVITIPCPGADYQKWRVSAERQ